MFACISLSFKINVGIFHYSIFFFLLCLLVFHLNILINFWSHIFFVFRFSSLILFFSPKLLYNFIEQLLLPLRAYRLLRTLYINLINSFLQLLFLCLSTLLTLSQRLLFPLLPPQTSLGSAFLVLFLQLQELLHALLHL